MFLKFLRLSIDESTGFGINLILLKYLFFLKIFGDDVMKHFSINSRFDKNFSFLFLFKNSLDTESIYHEQILILFSLQ